MSEFHWYICMSLGQSYGRQEGEFVAKNSQMTAHLVAWAVCSYTIHWDVEELGNMDF